MDYWRAIRFNVKIKESKNFVRETYAYTVTKQNSVTTQIFA